MPPCASSSSWSGLQHSLQVVPLHHSRLGRRPAGGPPLSIPCRRTPPPHGPGGPASIAGRCPRRMHRRGGSHAPLTPSWCCVYTPALAGSTTLCGLVKGQAAQHCYGSAPYAPFTGSRQGGVSHDCARLSEPRSFDDGQDRGSNPAHTFPRSVTARSRGSHESAKRCVTCRGTGVGTAAWCQSQGRTGPVRSRASWWQGNMVQRARDLPDHRTLPPSPSRSTPAGGRALRTLSLIHI